MGVAVLLLFALPVAGAPDRAGALIDRIAGFHAVEPARFLAQGSAFVMDSTHPQHPGDSRREDLTVRLAIDASRGDAVLDTSPSSAPVVLPEEKDNWGAQVLAPEEIVLREVAPHVFTIDLRALNSRVIVAEFQDHLAVLEGVFNSTNGDLLARTLQKRFGKPIRYFAFSRLHGQYLGGVRSYVHAGATVLVPPTTAPLIEEVVKARHDLRPDGQSRDPKPLRVQVVKDSLVLEDPLNALRIDNVVSEHTDEYLIFSFPRQKLMMTGDLLFYRGPDQPLRGRSKRLCETVAKLGLAVETMYVSWPLEGYNGVHNTVRFDEFRAACERP